MKQHKMKPS